MTYIETRHRKSEPYHLDLIAWNHTRKSLERTDYGLVPSTSSSPLPPPRTCYAAIGDCIVWRSLSAKSLRWEFTKADLISIQSIRPDDFKESIGKPIIPQSVLVRRKEGAAEKDSDSDKQDSDKQDSDKQAD